MTTKPQPEALHIADECEHSAELWLNEVHSRITAAAELRRLHAECEALRADRDSWERQCSDRVDDAVEFLRQRDEARAECQALRSAFNAACAFIDCHVADWDLTKEMVSNHAAFVKARAAIDAARAAKEQSK